MNKKIYVVETASYDGKGRWDNETSVNYFASKSRAAAYCERWMANYKEDYPDGVASNPKEGVYHFTFADGAIEEYQFYSAPLQ